MAWISEYTVKTGPDKGKKKWKVLIRMVGFPSDTTYFYSLDEAKAFEQETEARLSVERAEDKDPRASLPKSGDWDDELLAKTIELFSRSEECKQRHWGFINTVIDAIGKDTIRQLRPSWVDAYVAKMRVKQTKRNTFFAYESIFAQLCFINAVLKWRAKKLDLPRRRLEIDTGGWPKGWQKKRTRRFEEGEEEALLATLAAVDSPARAHWGLLVRLCIETCTRLQELTLAEWPEFSKNERYWDIPAGHTKAKAARQMPLTYKAKVALRELKALAMPGNPRVFHTMGDSDSVSALFHRYSLRAGLVDFRAHDLRHEGISRFVSTQSGMDLGRIGLLVGHTSTEMTKRYTHLRGDDVADMLIDDEPKAQPPQQQPQQPQQHHQPNLWAAPAIAMFPFTFGVASMRIESWLPMPKALEQAKEAPKPAPVETEASTRTPSHARRSSFKRSAIRAAGSRGATPPRRAAQRVSVPIPPCASIDCGRETWGEMGKTTATRPSDGIAIGVNTSGRSPSKTDSCSGSIEAT